MSTPTAPFSAPLDLQQAAPNQCLSCCAANVLHMFGLGNGDLRAVDRHVGRRRGQTARHARTSRLLLESGLALRTITAYAPERFLTHGLDYLRSYYRKEWDSGWDEYWTAQNLARHHQECLDAVTLEDLAGYNTERRRPTLVDVRSWLDWGRVVMLALDTGEGVTCHAALIYHHRASKRGGSFDVYVPQRQGSSLDTYSSRDTRRAS